MACDIKNNKQTQNASMIKVYLFLIYDQMSHETGTGGSGSEI